jgi:ribonucleoside-diphosphate reductase alpha chain
MQITATPTAVSPMSAGLSPKSEPMALSNNAAFAHYQIIRRNGAVVSFEPSKIAVALMKAFLAVHGTQGAASASVR